MSTLTFSGMRTGCLPMRLMVWISLPNVAEQFTAGFVAAAVLGFHETLGSGNDRDAEAFKDARDIGVAVVKAAAGRGDALDAGDGGCAVHVLELHDEGLVTLVIDRSEERRVGKESR